MDKFIRGNICAPAPEGITRKREYCPTCEKVTVFQTVFYEWYGGDITCLSCGDRWNEDGRVNRPFRRYWKEERLKRVNKLWEYWTKKRIKSISKESSLGINKHEQ